MKFTFVNKAVAVPRRGTFAASVALAATCALTLGFASCAETDIVAKVANASFAALVAALPGGSAPAEGGAAWALTSPGGDRFTLSADFAAPGADASFSFEAAPFLAAGLDIAKFAAPDGVGASLEGDRLVYRFELGADRFPDDAKASMAAAFAALVRNQRARIGYHEKLDHYGIKLGGGNMIEWAKDLSTNDKDLVFVLDPAPFIKAGVDPAKIAGWAFAKVETKDDAGKAITVDKLLRPFNLK